MMRILAVDDVPFNLDVIAATFEGTTPSVEVVTAEGGAAALDLLRDGGPVDVMILDLQMPAPDGYEVLRRVRADPALATLPVVVLTASAEERDRALSLGATDFVPKPFDVGELRRRCLAAC
jgi:CheY-like chemotaxis protein